MVFIDLHTHNQSFNSDILSIQNIFHTQASAFTSKSKGFYSIGIHPWHTTEYKNSDIDVIASIAEYKNILAIGECGIDKLKGGSLNTQTKIFIEQAKIAERVEKPVIIHCVKAYDEIIALRKQFKPTVPWIIHDFRKNLQLAEQMIKLGFKLSFGKIIKYNLNSFKKLLCSLPDNSYFFESDDADIELVEFYKLSAEIKNITIEELTEKTRINFEECFKIKVDV